MTPESLSPGLTCPEHRAFMSKHPLGCPLIISIGAWLKFWVLPTPSTHTSPVPQIYCPPAVPSQCVIQHQPSSSSGPQPGSSSWVFLSLSAASPTPSHITTSFIGSTLNWIILPISTIKTWLNPQHFSSQILPLHPNLSSCLCSYPTFEARVIFSENILIQELP